MGLQRRISRANLVRTLLACGVAYSLLYVVENDVIAARRYAGYSRMSQAISELSAKGAPTRKFLAATLPLPAALMTAFGIGVAKSASGNRALRVTGGLLVAGGPLSFAWLPFPMSSRADIQQGAGAGNDVGHLVLSGATGLLILSQMGSAAAAFGRPFRLYSLASAATVLVFLGVLTGRQAARLAKDEPTAWLGLYERTGMAAWLQWMAVLAIKLLQATRAESRGVPSGDGKSSLSRNGLALETHAGEIHTARRLSSPGRARLPSRIGGANAALSQTRSLRPARRVLAP